MKKIVITGANGFVGRHLVAELERSGVSVVGVGGPGGTNDSGATDFISLDLTHAEEASKIDFQEIDGVIHLAGLAAVGPSFDNPMRYVTTNVGIETNLFEAALAQKAQPRFLVISTGALYDPSAGLPLTETSPVLPSSPYAVSKLSQEQMAQYYANRGLKVIIARPFNHVGPGQGPGFIVPDIAQQVIAYSQDNQSEVAVGNLDAQRDYTDVRDIARAYRLLIEKGRSGEIYNICSGKALSGHDILSGIAAAARVEPKVTQDAAKMRPSDNPIIYGDHSKLTEATGWQPEIPIKTTLADVVADWQARSKA